jgi:hypothetical protein
MCAAWSNGRRFDSLGILVIGEFAHEIHCIWGSKISKSHYFTGKAGKAPFVLTGG